jgi:hypothetical protein
MIIRRARPQWVSDAVASYDVCGSFIASGTPIHWSNEGTNIFWAFFDWTINPQGTLGYGLAATSERRGPTARSRRGARPGAGQPINACSCTIDVSDVEATTPQVLARRNPRGAADADPGCRLAGLPPGPRGQHEVALNGA